MCHLQNSGRGLRSVAASPSGALRCRVVYFQPQLRLKAPLPGGLQTRVAFLSVGFLTWHAQEVLPKQVLTKETSCVAAKYISCSSPEVIQEWQSISFSSQERQVRLRVVLAGERLPWKHGQGEHLSALPPPSPSHHHVRPSPCFLSRRPAPSPLSG